MPDFQADQKHLQKQWQIAEETAAEHGAKMNRKNWRVVVVMHIAEDKEQALKEIHAGERRETYLIC